MPQGLQSPLRGIRSPFGAQAGSRAKQFANGKTNVLSWCFDDLASDMGSVYIADTVTPANNFNSSASAAILAKFTGWSATSPMMVRDPDGTLKHAPHNVAPYSEDFDNAAWVKTECTVTGNAIAAPSGYTKADKFIPSVNATSHYINQASISGVMPTFSILAKLEQGSSIDKVTLFPGGSLTFAHFNLTAQTTSKEANVDTNTITALADGWFLLTATWPGAATWDRVRIYASGGSVGSAATAGNGTEGIYFCAIHARREPMHTGYLRTSATALYSIPTTYDTSGNKLGFLSWEARTNAAWWSRDLTQSAHVKTNATAYLTAKGTDGIANSASRLVATAANGNVIQSITATSAQRVSSAKVRRSKGSGTVKMSQGETTGSELVSNGTFDTVTTGWTAFNDAVLSVASGRLRVTNNVTDYGSAYQTLTTVAGKLYKITFEVVVGTGTAWRLNVGTTVGASNLVTVTSSGAGTFTYYFLATSTASTVQLVHNTTNDTSYIDFDNVSVLECTETTLSLNTVAYSEVSGTELKSTGVTALLGSATAASYNTSSGDLSVSRVDSGNQSYINFTGLTAGKMYAVAFSVISGSITVRQSSFAIVQTITTPDTVYIIPSSTSFVVTSTLDSTTSTATISSVKEVEPSQAWTEVETAAATITNPCVAIWCATGGDAIDVDHVQCEVPTVVLAASPPIITAGAAVTRAANDLRVAKTLFNLNDTEGTVVVWGRFGSPAAGQYPVAALMANASNDGFFTIAGQSGDIINGQTYTGASTFTGTPSLVAFTPNALTKLAYRYKANDFAQSVNGAAVQTDVSGALPTVNASHAITIGSFHAGARSICGVISKFLYVGEGETNAELVLRAS